MKNVYEIRKEQHLYYILPEDISHCIEEDTLKETAIIVCLYYEDTVEKYFRYLESLQMGIDLYIVSSNKKVHDEISTYMQGKNKDSVYYIQKENRGRDVSALLVTCREIIKKYQYFCFLHDKKPLCDLQIADTENWIENLWGNCLKTEPYIRNVLHIFKTKPQIGVLAPPEPLGEYFTSWYIGAWGNDFENTKKLASYLKLNCDISLDFPPVTLGTAFWGKTDALRKLFEHEWRYEDFHAEPMPRDGTFSHAVERIFAYVAQDAGYDTGTIMCSSYAESQTLFLQESMGNAFQILQTELKIANIFQARGFEKRKKFVVDFAEKNKRIYLYGAGKKGKTCHRILEMEGYHPLGYIVTNKEIMNEKVNGIPVIEWKKLDDISNIGIIVTVRDEIRHEIMQNLSDRGFTNYILSDV